MSMRWLSGVCLGCGLALITSGVAQMLMPISPHADQPSSASKEVEETLFLMPEELSDDRAAGQDRALADKFTRALEHRTGVSVSRTARNHAADIP